MNAPATACLMGLVVAAAACIPGAGCNTNEDCPAPMACQDNRCGNPGRQASSSGAEGPVYSCRQLLAQQPQLTGVDGLHDVDVPLPDGGTRSATVWCDMTTAGGGWTLVGRSVPSGSPPSNFGWHSSAGNAGDDLRAHSFNVSTSGATFTEILFGAYDSGKVWLNAYRVMVPENFLTAFRTRALYVWPPTVAVGGCTPPDPMGQPGFMGSYVGFTANTDMFFFRDNDQNSNFGLHAQNWNLSGNDTDCLRNGLLQGHAGMVMVR